MHSCRAFIDPRNLCGFSRTICQAFIDPHNLCGSSWPGIPSYPVTLFLRSLSQNHSFSLIPFGCPARCSGVLMMGCLPSSSTVSPHRDWVNLEMHSEAVIMPVWRCLGSPRWCELGGHNRASLEIHWEAGIERVWRCTWKAVIVRTWSP